MIDLIEQLNALHTYPSVADLHDLAETLKQYSAEDIDTLLASLNNQLLVSDIKRLVDGAMPSTMTAPIFVQPVAPNDPGYADLVRTEDPGFSCGGPPQIKPL